MKVFGRCLGRCRAASVRAAAVSIVGVLVAALAVSSASGLGVDGRRPGTLTQSAHSAVAKADYGDAPDGTNAGYVTAPHVIGYFPTLAKSNGAHHTDASGALRLGQKVDVEADSRQVNRDTDDDGFFAQLRACRSSTLTFVVNASGLPVAMRSRGHVAYLNALFDWDRDGYWRGASGCGGHKIPEWVLQNHPVDMAKFADQPIQAIQVTVPAGPQVKELWIRATLTLDQQMKSAGRGAFSFGETEDYFYSGTGPTPALKGKKKKKAKKGVPDSLSVDCLGGFLPHGTSGSFSVVFSDANTGAWVNPTPGSVHIQLANGQPGLAALPGDVAAKAFSYGYRVTSKLKDERLNPFESVLVWVKVSSTRPGERVELGSWSLGLPTSKGVILACFVLILHSHHVPTGGPPGGGGPPAGGGPPGGPGQPGGPGTGTDQAPIAAFTFSPNNAPTAPKPGTVVSFDGSGSADPDGTVVSWSWSVGAPLHGGGGTVSVSGAATPHASISFPSPGIYPVTLTVTDNAGKTGSVTHNVAISGPGSKLGTFSTDPMDALGCSGSIMAIDDIYIPTFAQSPVTIRGTATGGCAGATIAITKITRQSSNAPPDNMGNPRVDEWGNVKDTIHIEFTISGGTSAQGTVPFTVSWQ
jgi:hypothetical protein